MPSGSPEGFWPALEDCAKSNLGDDRIKTVASTARTSARRNDFACTFRPSATALVTTEEPRKDCRSSFLGDGIGSPSLEKEIGRSEEHTSELQSLRHLV